MSWEDARKHELAHWTTVRDAIGTADPVELLTEINATDAFCEKVRVGTGGLAGEPVDYCSRCLFYEQFGGCRETSGRMSERVAAGDREGLRVMVNNVISQLRELDVPRV